MRVVVTAVGVVSAIGCDFDTFTTGITTGASGGGAVTLFDASKFPTRIAAEVKGLELQDDVCDRKTALARAAADAAFADTGELGPRRAVSLGTGLSSVVARELEEDLAPNLDGDELDLQAYGKELLARGKYSPARHMTENANRYVAKRFDVTGGSLSHFSACSAGLQSVGWGFREIREGRLDAVIAGGQDSMVHPFGMISFMLLGALSTRNENPAGACRPFDKGRDGFLMGEGAAVLVLQGRERALATGAHIYGEIVGFGTSVDGHNVTAPDPRGAGAAAAMRAALTDAELQPDAIGYVNAHGTGTALNDPAEAAGIQSVFAGHTAKLAVSSVKPLIGHTIAAAGAMEVLACLAAMRAERLPPNANLETVAPECAHLDLVVGEGRAAAPEYLMTNSYGFGGQNASVILRRP